LERFTVIFIADVFQETIKVLEGIKAAYIKTGEEIIKLKTEGSLQHPETAGRLNELLLMHQRLVQSFVTLEADERREDLKRRQEENERRQQDEERRRQDEERRRQDQARRERQDQARRERQDEARRERQALEESLHQGQRHIEQVGVCVVLTDGQLYLIRFNSNMILHLCVALASKKSWSTWILVKIELAF